MDAIKVPHMAAIKVVVVPQGSLQGRHRKTSIAYNIIWHTTPFVETARMSDVTST